MLHAMMVQHIHVLDPSPRDILSRNPNAGTHRNAVEALPRE